MAAVEPVLKHRDGKYEVWEWTPLVNAAVGGPLNMHSFNDTTIKMYGTPSTGGEVTMYGSLNLPGETVDAGSPLEEESGVPILLVTADRWATPRGAPLQIWPSVTGGDGSTSMTVRAVIRR